MIEYYKKFTTKQKLKRTKNYEKSSWIKITDPDEEEINYITDNFKLEKNLIKDGLDVHEVPRIEEENRKAYFFLNAPTSKKSVAYAFPSIFTSI